MVGRRLGGLSVTLRPTHQLVPTQSRLIPVTVVEPHASL